MDGDSAAELPYQVMNVYEAFAIPALLLTTNVTALTRERLHAILSWASVAAKPAGAVPIVALQETRHGEQHGWARDICRRRGWCVHFSPAPPHDRRCQHGHGGTAILWP